MPVLHVKAHHAGSAVSRAAPRRGAQTHSKLPTQDRHVPSNGKGRPMCLVLTACMTPTSASSPSGGGAVLRPMNWSYMHQGVVVWLNGPTDLLAKRVAKDGLSKRPLLAPEGSTASVEEVTEDQLYASAKAKLDTLLAERTQYYETADLKISLEGYGSDADKGAPTAVVMYRLLCALKKKIDDTKKEREDRKNFTIEYNGEVRASSCCLCICGLCDNCWGFKGDLPGGCGVALEGRPGSSLWLLAGPSLTLRSGATGLRIKLACASSLEAPRATPRATSALLPWTACAFLSLLPQCSDHRASHPPLQVPTMRTMESPVQPEEGNQA